MGIILWVLFGALIGWIASKITGTDAQQGAIGNIAVGIIGAIIGGWVANMLGFAGVTGFNLPSMLIALAGAVLVLAAYNTVAAKRY